MPEEKTFEAVAEEHRRLANVETKIKDAVIEPSWDELSDYATALRRLERYKHLFEAAEARHNLPPGILRAIAATESRGRRGIITGELPSTAGAVGMMQFMRDTADDYGLIVDENVDERTDPAKAITAAAKKVSHDLEDTGGNIELTAAYYNAGPTATKRWLAGDQRLPTETRRYMGKVRNLMLEVPEAPTTSVAEAADTGQVDTGNGSP